MDVMNLHSEYRSTYRWHEYTGPRQEVIRRPPQSVAAAGGGSGVGKTVSQITLLSPLIFDGNKVESYAPPLFEIALEIVNRILNGNIKSV
ncbi:hypothetical protein J437_LFUL008203 [Ladona fulva]|uniref:Uncharacterized protein n=1 Tax=Ladona fulva TaxID=123851 RepID=A0A8K0K3Y3_LADFU|nr:hypothetical protein J437_LFUL008203 [Ladona fulva]